MQITHKIDIFLNKKYTMEISNTENPILSPKPSTMDDQQNQIEQDSQVEPLPQPEPQSHTHSPSFSITNVNVGITISTKRVSSKFIPDSEIFDLESLFVLTTPERKEILASNINPPLFCYFDPPTLTAPEINFNDINVFQTWKDLENLECIDSDKVRSILVNPLQDFRPFDEMKMMLNDGSIRPCHLPFFGDLYGMSDVFFILLGWEMEKLDKLMSPRFLPEYLRLLIDPRPVLKLDGPVHDFGHEPVRIAMGTYTDAMHISKLVTSDTIFKIRVLRSSVFVKRSDGEQRPKRWYHEVVLVPGTVVGEGDIYPVEEKSTIVVWSGRGVARLSFPYHFNLLVDVYRPKIVVVVESRLSQKNLVQMMDDINPSYECGMFGSENFYGGVLIFWNSNSVQLMGNKNFNKGCKADVTVKGQPKSKIRKCLFMEDATAGKDDEFKIK